MSVAPVAGSSTSMVDPSEESRHSPPMKRPVGTLSSSSFSVMRTNLGQRRGVRRGRVRTRAEAPCFPLGGHCGAAPRIGDEHMAPSTAPDGIDVGVPPTGTGCADCDSATPPGWWVHLRRCAQCGHIGCCDTSPGQHASAHAEATGIPSSRASSPARTGSSTTRPARPSTARSSRLRTRGPTSRPHPGRRPGAAGLDAARPSLSRAEWPVPRAGRRSHAQAPTRVGSGARPPQAQFSAGPSSCSQTAATTTAPMLTAAPLS